jgi:hypothetical protein
MNEIETEAGDMTTFEEARQDEETGRKAFVEEDLEDAPHETTQPPPPEEAEQDNYANTDEKRDS